MKYEDMSIRDLQKECADRGLATGRVKAELVARLNADDEVRNSPSYVAPAVPPFPYAHETWLMPPTFHVAYRFDGRLTPSRDMAFQEHVLLLALAEGLTPIGPAGTTLFQGGTIRYAVTVAGKGRK